MAGRSPLRSPDRVREEKKKSFLSLRKRAPEETVPSAMLCSSPWDGGLIMIQCHPDLLCHQLSSLSQVTFTHIIPWVPRSKFISLILHQRTSAYLLHEKPFSTCEMKLKTTSWEVYMRNEICIISYWEQSRSGLKSSQNCRENECKALYLLAIPKTWLHIKDYISALFLRQETKTQTLSQEQVRQDCFFGRAWR